ncbi:MAG TPA: glutamine synthetase III [Candidatus Scatomorpha merdigallinarum]|nr:glutamine synthetase III [Candidatus Scatomorpha merdigallinarum]
MPGIKDIFGTMVFSDAVMRERLPKEAYEAVLRTMKSGRRLQPDTAEVVAEAMRDWAVEKGATHFTHWFQPMTGITAEKHDSFVEPDGHGGVIMEFSGKELIHGEPDASSFPSGGLRATFEARGYTAWDPTSYAFIRDGVLYIPTAFCSYGGEALDQKTPLLRSMEALSRQAVRVLKLFGHEDVTAVSPMVGAEQEYFLVERDMYERRQDLIYTGRTLFGAAPPKGQELDDHYFGTVKPRIAAFMREINEELWKLGVYAKTEHNEAAPAQHELACIYDTANIAADHNQLIMDVMQKTAKRHGLVCLLHEKPFDGVNGSGKHNNWSMATNTGDNLFSPGDTPGENAQFLLFLCAVIKAADDYQDVLRISVARAGNDHRLGAAEAPPAIISIFLGDELTDILEAIENDSTVGAREKTLFKVGVHALPPFPKDTTDRNRTSPFAYTGSKFEFRMPGSSASISSANIALNTAVAEELRQFADELENASDFSQALHDLIRRVVREHKRIIFNGNGYDPSWVEEAQRRGLHNLRSTPEALPHLVDPENVELFTRHKVFSESELRARLEVFQEEYCKLVTIEGKTALAMVRREILPAVSRFTARLAEAAAAQLAILPKRRARYECSTVNQLTQLMDAAYSLAGELEDALITSESIRELERKSCFLRDKVLSIMGALRAACDDMESVTADDAWPIPTYGELLYGVK